MTRLRLDKLLLDRKLVPTREKAQFLIMTGKVLVNDVKITKSGQSVKDDSIIRLLTEIPQYVSRGGLKLEGAFEHFKFGIDHRHALDVGISTGGFSDFLLQHNIGTIVGLDVGYGQVDLRVKNDPRVTVCERINARLLTPDTFDTLLVEGSRSHVPRTTIDLVVMDLSFISVTKVLPAITTIVPKGDYIILIKPQFEAERSEIGKGGIVKDQDTINTILDRVRNAISSCFEFCGQCASPITGTKGNQEYFFWLRPLPTPTD